MMACWSAYSAQITGRPMAKLDGQIEKKEKMDAVNHRSETLLCVLYAKNATHHVRTKTQSFPNVHAKITCSGREICPTKKLTPLRSPREGTTTSIRTQVKPSIMAKNVTNSVLPSLAMAAPRSLATAAVDVVPGGAGGPSAVVD